MYTQYDNVEACGEVQQQIPRLMPPKKICPRLSVSW